MTASEKLFAEGLARVIARHPTLSLDLDWDTAISILACLQLSLRHPGNKGPSARLSRAFCDALISRVEEVDPTLAKLLRMGDDPQHDTPRTST